MAEEPITMKMEGKREVNPQEKYRGDNTYEGDWYSQKQWSTWIRLQRLERLRELYLPPYRFPLDAKDWHESILQANKKADENPTEENKKAAGELISEFTKERESWWKRGRSKCDIQSLLKTLLPSKINFWLNTHWLEKANENWYKMSPHDFELLIQYEECSYQVAGAFIFSMYKEWVALMRLIHTDFWPARKRHDRKVLELIELEHPRLRSKQRKGLLFPPEDDTRKLIEIKRNYVPMHPFVDAQHKDKLEVGDYMRVSTNQWYKSEFLKKSPIALGGACHEDPEHMNEGYHRSILWAKHVRSLHPKYKDTKTRAEINAQRIAKIKQAYPDHDYF